MTDGTSSGSRPLAPAASPGHHHTARYTTGGLLVSLAVPVAVGVAVLAMAAPVAVVAGLAGVAVGAVAGVAVVRRVEASADGGTDDARASTAGAEAPR